MNLTTKIHILDTENKQKLNIIKATLHIQTKECTTHQTAALRAQIKDFAVLCSTLLHRTGPYVITLADKMLFLLTVNGIWGDVPPILRNI